MPSDDNNHETSMDQFSVDDLLRILGNENRRLILKLLSSEPQYAFQLAKNLKISQKAVDKHMKILEDAGLIEKYTRKSSIGPDRNYYTIKKSLSLTFGLSSNLYRVDFWNFPFNVISRIVIPETSNELRVDDMIAEQIRMNIIKTTELNERIAELGKVRNRLSFEREEALKVVMHYLDQLDVNSRVARSIISLLIKYGGEAKEDEILLPLAAERSEEIVREVIDVLIEHGILKSYSVDGSVWYIVPEN
ncbi:MAG: ArsR/SmtB family transcription factor [Candidatus Odinarchaeota archaeon]